MFDGADIAELEVKLRDAEEEMKKYTEAVSESQKNKTAFSRDEKALLARYQAPYIADKKSVAVSEVLAMANPEYIKEYDALKERLRKSCKHILDFDNLIKSWDTARSLLSTARSGRPAAWSAAGRQEG